MNAGLVLCSGESPGVHLPYHLNRFARSSQTVTATLPLFLPDSA